MEENYALNLAISILIFAPGLVLLAIALFVGILASLERAGLFRVLQRRDANRVAKQTPAHANRDA